MGDLAVLETMEFVIKKRTVYLLPWIEYGDIGENPRGNTPPPPGKSFLNLVRKMPAVEQQADGYKNKSDAARLKQPPPDAAF
jgi:hypothetical protein